MEDSAKMRLGLCPKCQTLLLVLADYSVFKCGGCGAVLRAKHKGYISLLEISDEGEVEGNDAKSGTSSGSTPIGREQREQKSQMGHEKGSKFTKRMSNWHDEEIDEMEGF